MLTMGLSTSVRQSRVSMLGYLLAYNLGRIASYSIAGAILGWFGASLSSVGQSSAVLQVGHWLSVVFMLALGIYLAGWTRALAPIEQAGTYVWKYIQPLGKPFLPVSGQGHALGLGLVWGWLPCGMVYAALVFALASADPARGASIMLAFGLGTLPALMLTGTAARWFGNLARTSWVRRGAGAVIVLFAVVSLLLPQGMHQHHAHGSDGGTGTSAPTQNHEHHH
jgi:sulfite exporter TauE/SafE